MYTQTCPRPGPIRLALTAYCNTLIRIDPAADRARAETSTAATSFDHIDDIDGAWTLTVSRHPRSYRRAQLTQTVVNSHVGTNTGILIQSGGDIHRGPTHSPRAEAPEECLVTLPPESEILADIDHGNLMLKGNIRMADVMVSHGNFTTSKVTSLRANISHGDTYVGTRPDGPVIVHTDHGNIRVTCRTKDTLQATTHHGNIDLRFPTGQHPHNYLVRANPGTVTEH